MLNLVYFGTPAFSAQILESLFDKTLIKPVAVVTNPDQPAGRRQILTSSPVALFAASRHLPCFKAKKLDSDNLTHLKLLQPDIFLVAAYGQIIPPEYLSTPPQGTLNIHFSLLPYYRGALCVSEAIKNQDSETGVTLMLMDEKLDHGPIIAQKQQNISPEDNVATLTAKLTQTAINLLHTTLPPFLNRQIVPKTQDELQATYTPKTSSRTHQSAFIPWEKIKPCLTTVPNINNCKVLNSEIHSLNPDPGAWTKIDSLELKILTSSVEKQKLILTTVQLPGKSPITWSQFLSGHPQVFQT